MAKAKKTPAPEVVAVADPLAIARAAAQEALKSIKLTHLEQLAINHICMEAGNAADTKEYMHQDNMTWFNGALLMLTLNISWQGAGGLITSLEKKGLALRAGNQKPDKNNPNPSNYCLTDLGIEASTFLK